MKSKPSYKFDNLNREDFIELSRVESSDERCVAVIGKKKNGTFTYEIVSWDDSDVELIGSADGYWGPKESGGYFSDEKTAYDEAAQYIKLHDKNNET